MKLFAAAIAGASSAVLALDKPPAPIASLPSYEEPATAWKDIHDAAPVSDCRDRIEQVRNGIGRPELQRKPVTDEGPLLQYAVDRRIDGCSVLVPVIDPQDLRVPPEPSKPELRAARPKN